MNTTLVKHGDALALIIDQSMLDLLQITVDTRLELTMNQGVLQITPVGYSERQKKLEASLSTINQKYGEVLKKLAE
jgi:antitoxin component of MazEF toxin-antitoxin module